MKKLNIFSLVVIALVSIFVVSPMVFAETTMSTTPTTVENKTTTTLTPTTKNAMSATDTKADIVKKRAERQAANKLKYTVKLAAAEETKLKGVCKASQQKVKSLEERSTKANTTRGEAYARVNSRLTKLAPSLELAKVDTAELIKDQDALKVLITTYNTDFATYKTDLNDLSEMDCAADPAAFKSAIEAARADRIVVVKDATEVRTFIVSKLSVTLKKISDSLDTTKSTSTTEPAAEVKKKEAL